MNNVSIEAINIQLENDKTLHVSFYVLSNVII